MGWFNQVIESDVAALKIIEEIVENKNITSFRMALDDLPRIISSMQRRLDVLRVSEQYLKGKILVTATAQEIEDKFSGDRFKTVKAVQSFETLDIGMPDPHQDISYIKNKYMQIQGMRDMEGEWDKIDHEITNLQKEEEKALRILKEITKKLDDEKEGPSKSEIEKDRLVELNLQYLYFLYQIHLRYKLLSKQSDGKRGWSQERKVVRALRILEKKFRQHLYWMPKLYPKLDLTDIGSDKNGSVLRIKLQVEKQIGQTLGTKSEKLVTKYTEELVRSINDPYISKELNRNKDAINSKLQAIVKEKGSMKEETSSLAKFNEVTKKIFGWWTNFTLENQMDAVERLFYRDIQNLWVGNPYCKDPKKTKSSEELAKEKAEGEDALAETEGQKKYKESKDKAEQSGEGSKPYMVWETLTGTPWNKVKEIADLFGYDIG
ncbi:MAG: hypothetical protein ACTSRU_13505, partial [Candidatus Hodarchaeales archaeon]